MTIKTIEEAINEASNLRNNIEALKRRIDELDDGTLKARTAGKKRVQISIAGAWTVVPTVTAENINRELREARECFLTRVEQLDEVISMANKLTKGALSE